MNQSKLKRFAVEARRELLEKVALQARLIGITKDKIKDATIESSDALIINGQHLSKEERIQRNKLIQRIQDNGYEQVMEEAAYTWFNRFVALRFMEVNDYLPTRVRVLSSIDGGNEPDMMKEALTLGLDVDSELVYSMKLNNQDDELFKYLIIAHCNDLNNYLPFMFGTIEDYTEILFPEGLLISGSFVRTMTDVEVFPEEDWKKVEIVGWLYQFYISEQKDEVFKNLKKNIKIGKKDIGPATQLFTPRWIVEYMVDNSLGRLWLESNPDKDLQESLEYYLEDAKQTEEVKAQLEALKDPNLEVESIKFMDPSCGSGHILVYAFELFYKIYLSRGYLEREIPQLILNNNLYGLDIDTRATQLATFAIVMKAREYDRRLFNREYSVHIHSIEESNSFSEDELKTFSKDNKEVYTEVQKLVDAFYDGKLYGSIIQVPEINIELIEEQIDYIQNEAAVYIFTTGIVDYLIPLLEDLIAQYRVLNQKYEVVVTNPPYMSSRGMEPKLSIYLKKHYPDEKSDLFAVFMEVTRNLTKNNFYTATINQQSWMFLSSFEKIRKKLIEDQTIINMIHLGTRTFEEIGGEVVQNTAYVLRKLSFDNFNGSYIRMVDIKNAVEKKNNFSNTKLYFTNTQINFKKIPGSPVAYWATECAVENFQNGLFLKELAKAAKGLDTGNNNKFIRKWYEINIEKKNIKWYQFNKGGGYRKWYGNLEYLIDWENEGEKVINYPRSNIRNKTFYFEEGYTWTLISSDSKFGLRYLPEGGIFDANGMMLFPYSNDGHYLMGILNSKVNDYYLKILSSTLAFVIGDINRIPIITVLDKEFITKMVEENITISKDDWNTFETSWDFEQHPFLTYKEEASTIEDSFNKWEEIAETRFYQLKENEEELNRIFIDLYGLQDELTPEVEEKDITVRKADKERDVKSFLSYLVGILFGRYSLDEEGLVYAGGEFDASKYETYKVVKDNIIPITSDVYLEDDLVNRFIKFIETVYGKETLEENLSFIAEALGQKKNETSRDTIHSYFLNDFFKDHAKMYSVTGSGRRPIYWKFTSGRENAFNCFIYMHRYDKTTISRIRTEYLHDVQQRLETRKIDLDQILNSDASTTELNRARKEMKTVEKQLVELVTYDEKLRHMADQQIEIDLDDGFKVNYAKFKDLVEKV